MNVYDLCTQNEKLVEVGLSLVILGHEAKLVT